MKQDETEERNAWHFAAAAVERNGIKSSKGSVLRETRHGREWERNQFTLLITLKEFFSLSRWFIVGGVFGTGQKETNRKSWTRAFCEWRVSCKSYLIKAMIL